jgi:acetyltransferase-like isoleucine patch superfamily enzyme
MFKIDPLYCSKLMGVRIGLGSRVYGNSPNMWGTEPFLIKIGKGVFITDGCKFITHDGGSLILRKEQPDLEYTAPIVVGDNVYFGIDTLVLPGVNIGDNVVIGARSVITKDVPSNSVVAGTPARVLDTLENYFTKFKHKSLKIGDFDRDSKEKELKKIFKTFIEE